MPAKLILADIKRPAHKIRKKDPAVITPPEKPKPVETKPETNIFGISDDTIRYTETGRITKAGWILEFHKLRNGYCLKLFDEIKKCLDTRAYMVSEKEHLTLLLKSWDRICVSVWTRKDKLSIAEMKAVILKAMADIQSNIVSNIILILPD